MSTPRVTERAPDLEPVAHDPFIDADAHPPGPGPDLGWLEWYAGEWRDPATALDLDLGPFYWR